MNDAPHGLSDQTVAAIHRILQIHPHVDKALLYGSRAQGNFKHGSDIDLTLLGKELATQDLMDIAGALDDSSIPYTVDVSIFETLNHPELKDHIQRVGVLFYERKPDAESAEVLETNKGLLA